MCTVSAPKRGCGNLFAEIAVICASVSDTGTYACVLQGAGSDAALGAADAALTCALYADGAAGYAASDHVSSALFTSARALSISRL